MLDFHDIEVSDKEWVKERLDRSDFRCCEYTFGNNFIWSAAYNIKIAAYKDFYVVKTGNGYLYPAGNGDINEVLSELKADAASRGKPLILSSAPRSKAEELKAVCGDKIEISPAADGFDYCYNVDDLANLIGKKYHSKRNFINRFEKYNWTYEPITPENIPDCKLILNKWYEENGSGDRSKKLEVTAAEKGLDNFAELDFSGGLLKVDGAPAAFTFGERLNGDAFDVHVEKALNAYDGAYPMINREFVRRNCMKFKYINREEDLGEENLRKAKMSYHPAFMEEKYRIVFK